MKWKDKLINDLLDSLKKDMYWSRLIYNAIHENKINIHLAIFNEPFLSLIIAKKKTMESRFSVNHVSPYNKINSNDIVLIKKSGGNVDAIFTAKNIKYFRNLSSDKISILNEKYGNQIGWDIDPEFLKNKSGAKYLTLMEISHLKTLAPIEVGKKDKTGWSVIKLGLKNTLFE